MIKTSKAREYEEMLSMYLLSKYREHRNSLSEHDNLKITMIIGSPRFITRDGRKSMTGGDWDGFIKASQDIIFSVLFPSCSDSQINEAFVELVYSKKDFFEYTIETIGPIRVID